MAPSGAHVGEAIPLEDKKAIEDVACYLVRAPLSLKKLAYLDGQKAVLYRLCKALHKRHPRGWRLDSSGSPHNHRPSRKERRRSPGRKC